MAAGKTIVVAGDLAVDWFAFPAPARDDGDNWQLVKSMRQAAMAGGAALLGQFVEDALEAAGTAANITRPRLRPPITALAPANVIHSNATLDPCKVGRDAKGTVLRVRRSHGFTGPVGGTLNLRPPRPDPEAVDLLVLDDVGNGFRDQPDAWPQAARSGRAGIVLYKMSRPLATGPLWKQVSRLGLDHLVVVINADDLRKRDEVFVSRALSWERTAKDVVFQLQRSNDLQPLRECPFLIVLFGTDGALLCRGGAPTGATLFFDPTLLEGAFAAGIDGTVFGLTSMFTANLAGALATHGIAGLDAAIPAGLARARTLLVNGYAKQEPRHNPGRVVIQHGNAQVADDHATAAAYVSCPVAPPSDLSDSDPRRWRILDQRTRDTRELLARQIVEKGLKNALKGVPVGTFGALRTVDRAEIESYSAIRELIVEYLDNPRPSRPLCFAVFGPPGAGKSFGVKQVLKSLEREDVAPLPAFNVSQFGGYRDLVASFHVVRNHALGGKTPVAFFDEFDAGGDGQVLGWLKYFLAPMQDGEFRDGEATHPIGKAVFVFAGGTRSSFERFQQNVPDEDTAPGGEETHTRLRAFRDAKGPDFVSRLRGFVNVMGPNRQGDCDDAFLIRRAMILRAMLEQSPKTTNSLRSDKQFRIDAGVLRAMLHVGKYRHGTRSIEALLDMSRLTGKQRFDLSALPPAEQLDQHVDANEFLFLAAHERFQSMLPPRDWPDVSGTVVPPERAHRAAEDTIVTEAAKKIHEGYRRHRELEGKTVGEHDSQLATHKKSNWDAAEYIPSKLMAVNHAIRRIPAGAEARTPDLSDDDVRKIARLEHDRWCAERRLQGYTYGEEKDEVRKRTPSLVKFDDLPAAVQQYDVEAARDLPGILKELGYEIYRLEEVAEFDEEMIDTLARAIHADYRRRREQEGQTPDTNPALVDFDALSPHLKASNRDSATTIPRKLRAVGYGIRRPPQGREPVTLELTRDEIETIAQIEHVRWNWHHWLNGWTYKAGEKKDENKRTHPCLLPWEQLTPEIQKYDRQSAELIATLLKEAGYEAYRLASASK